AHLEAGLERTARRRDGQRALAVVALVLERRFRARASARADERRRKEEPDTGRVERRFHGEPLLPSETSFVDTRGWRAGQGVVADRACATTSSPRAFPARALQEPPMRVL